MQRAALLLARSRASLDARRSVIGYGAGGLVEVPLGSDESQVDKHGAIPFSEMAK
jgi:hypothetical protein